MILSPLPDPFVSDSCDAIRQGARRPRSSGAPQPSFLSVCTFLDLIVEIPLLIITICLLIGEPAT